MRVITAVSPIRPDRAEVRRRTGDPSNNGRPLVQRAKSETRADGDVERDEDTTVAGIGTRVAETGSEVAGLEDERRSSNSRCCCAKSVSNCRR